MAGTLTAEVVPDAATLRKERRARALAEMEADGIDILILGREGNARINAAVISSDAECCHESSARSDHRARPNSGHPDHGSCPAAKRPAHRGRAGGG